MQRIRPYKCMLQNKDIKNKLLNFTDQTKLCLKAAISYLMKVSEVTLQLMITLLLAKAISSWSVIYVQIHHTGLACFAKKYA